MHVRIRVFSVWLAILIASCFTPAAAQTGTPPPSSGEPSTNDAPVPWWERLTFSGDFRARFEGFYQGDGETRQRGRFRLRVGVRAPITEDVALDLRLASGHAADVTSTNQTLTDFWNRKPVNIDQASIVYTPRRLRALVLGAGKFPFPVTRTQLVWDDDVNWEGAYQRFAWTAEPLSFRVTAVQSPLSDAGSGADAFMLGEYAEASLARGGHALQVSIANYGFRDADQIARALDGGQAIRTAQTNALRHDASGRVLGYESDFNLLDIIARATFDTGRPEYPLTALADVVVNTRAATDRDTGVWLTGTYGRAAVANTYALSYTFARVEQDAVVSAFNFSDMGPATNVLMHMAAVSFMPVRQINLDLTAIITRQLQVSAAAANPRLFRLQVDARVAF